MDRRTALRPRPDPGRRDGAGGRPDLHRTLVPSPLEPARRSQRVKRVLFRTRIKFCGMTRPGDVRLAGELGVDAVGFVFAEGSPRRLEPEEARTLRVALAPLVNAVAVFRNDDQRRVREVV